MPPSVGSPTTVQRAESIAYPRHHATTFATKLRWHLRWTNHRAIFATFAFVIFVLVVSSDLLHDSDLGPGQSLRGNLGFRMAGGSAGGANFAGATKRGYFSVKDSIQSETVFRFTALTDLDQLSLVDKASKNPSFRSVMLPGTITRNPETNRYSMQMEPTRELITKHNEEGRGAEFSELIIYNNRLLTFDDRTGGLFEILNQPDGKSSFCVPRYIITEGDGDTDKGMKWEWATVKNGELYMGSIGKEKSNPDGSIANFNMMWVSILNARREIRRVNWESKFTFVRELLGGKSPGYVVHEAVNWSPHLKKWVFAPRRISSEAYVGALDEKKGSNKLVLVDENFKNAEIVEVQMANRKDGLHGFSSFAFVPGTKDRHALALRSVEEDCAGDDLDVCKQRSYFVIFDVLTGEVLMDEVEIEEKLKYEGVEFVDMYTIPK